MNISSGEGLLTFFGFIKEWGLKKDNDGFGFIVTSPEALGRIDLLGLVLTPGPELLCNNVAVGVAQVAVLGSLVLITTKSL